MSDAEALDEYEELLSGSRINWSQLGENLKHARIGKKLRQAAVADYLGVVRTTIVAIEQGERRIKPAELAALAELYGLPVKTLVDDIIADPRKRPDSKGRSWVSATEEEARLITLWRDNSYGEILFMVAIKVSEGK